MRKLVLLLLLTALPLAAQETRYRLERIVVEGSRVADDIVRAESRLVEEREYAESDFRQALYRIRRLPFVTDAAYRIEPGVTAGSFTLVIRILDETPLFYDATLSVDSQRNGTTGNAAAAVGGRLLLDDLGVVETRVQTFDIDDGGAVTLTYRGYGFGDQGVFVITSLEQRFGVEGRTFDPAPSFTVGLPLTQAQTLTLSAGRLKSRVVTSFDVKGNDDPDDDDTFDDNVDLADRTHVTSAALQWHYETHDDPLFATRGVDAAGGMFWAEDAFLHEIYDRTEKEVVTGTETSGTLFGVGVEATAWQPIGARNVVSLGFAATGSDHDRHQLDLRPVRSYAGQARAGLAHDFHPSGDTIIRPWRARVEAGATYAKAYVDHEGRADDVHDGTTADAALVLRHRWGTLRLTGTYTFR